MKLSIKRLVVRKDDRGWLSELIKRRDVDGEEFGQLGVTTAHPGQVKGGHYHRRKREWFCVIRGRALLTLKDRESRKVTNIKMGEGNMVLVEIPRNHFHYIKNIGNDDMYLLFYTNEAFNPEDTDTFSEKKVDGSKIALATHSHMYSASQAMRDYLKQKGCPKLLYISHPLYLDDTRSRKRSSAEISNGKRVVSKFISPIVFNVFLLRTINEVLFSLVSLIKTLTVYDLYIGVDNLNAFVGLILKKVGFVKKVVYYTIDYYPQRFENKFLNNIYHLLDKYCVGHADETWNVSPVMKFARRKLNNMDPRIYRNQYTVPIGIWYNRARKLGYDKIDRKKMIFVGHLLPHMGVDLIIKALPRLKKIIRGIKFEIVGGGQEEANLKMLVKKLGLEKDVLFHGWIRGRKRLEKIMSTAAVGMATFNTKILDEKVKNADPGKIKDYMQAGMPVILTNAVATAGEIEKEKAGLVVEYSVTALVSAVRKILGKRGAFKEYRDGADKYVRKFDYPVIFEFNLQRALN